MTKSLGGEIHYQLSDNNFSSSNYTLIDKSMDASVIIGEGTIDKEKDTNEAKMPDMNFKAKSDLDFMAKIEREIKRFFKRLF